MCVKKIHKEHKSHSMVDGEIDLDNHDTYIRRIQKAMQEFLSV